MLDDIISAYKSEKEKDGSVSELTHKFGLTILPATPPDKENSYYVCHLAEGLIDGNIVRLTIKTRDNYRSFGNNREPYVNEILIFNGDSILFKDNFTAFE